MTRRRHGLALLSIVVLAAVVAIAAIACACAGSAKEAESGPPADGVTYLVKVTGAT